MIEVDLRAIKQGNETAADLSPYVGGSKVKDFPIHEDPANTDTIVETPITTLSFTTTDPTPTSDTAIALQKFGAGGDYLATFHAWRIWGLTAP